MGLILALLIIQLLFTVVRTDVTKEEKKQAFVFPEYPYKETSKNELAFHEFETACEQNAACTQQTGIARVRCVRDCISPSCYREIYQADELEEGEIDVRLNSFKGCFVQRLGRSRP